jgi:spore coat polysaccharide biosynthesis protein SpsF
VIPFHVLDLAWHEAKKPFEREHTTPFIWEHPERFRIGNVLWETGKDFSMSHRWTIDYPEDFILIKGIYDRLWTPDNPAFSLWEILQLLQNEPLLALVNAKYAGVNWYRHHLHELKTISPSQTRTASFN